MRATQTAQSILNTLPIQSYAQMWRQKVYFYTAVNYDLESDAKDLIDKGELAFWLQGSCIAIGFGPTPISQGNEFRLAANTNTWRMPITM